MRSRLGSSASMRGNSSTGRCPTRTSPRDEGQKASQPGGCITKLQQGGNSVTDRLLTTVVGSYPQPEWLVDRKNLQSRLPPRIRAHEIWRIPEPLLQQAQDDATLLAIRDMERAGIDIISDGEIRRESYSNRFATALDGMDLDNPGIALDRTGHPNPVPRVAGPIGRLHPVDVRDVEFLRRNTDRRIKITVPGLLTITTQEQDDYYNYNKFLELVIAE